MSFLIDSSAAPLCFLTKARTGASLGMTRGCARDDGCGAIPKLRLRLPPIEYQLKVVRNIAPYIVKSEILIPKYETNLNDQNIKAQSEILHFALLRSE